MWPYILLPPSHNLSPFWSFQLIRGTSSLLVIMPQFFLTTPQFIWKLQKYFTFCFCVSVNGGWNWKKRLKYILTIQRWTQFWDDQKWEKWLKLWDKGSINTSVLSKFVYYMYIIVQLIKRLRAITKWRAVGLFGSIPQRSSVYVLEVAIYNKA